MTNRCGPPEVLRREPPGRRPRPGPEGNRGIFRQKPAFPWFILARDRVCDRQGIGVPGGLEFVPRLGSLRQRVFSADCSVREEGGHGEAASGDEAGNRSDDDVQGIRVTNIRGVHVAQMNGQSCQEGPNQWPAKDRRAPESRARSRSFSRSFRVVAATKAPTATMRTARTTVPSTRGYPAMPKSRTSISSALSPVEMSGRYLLRAIGILPSGRPIRPGTEQLPLTLPPQPGVEEVLFAAFGDVRLDFG